MSELAPILCALFKKNRSALLMVLSDDFCRISCHLSMKPNFYNQIKVQYLKTLKWPPTQCQRHSQLTIFLSNLAGKNWIGYLYISVLQKLIINSFGHYQNTELNVTILDVYVYYPVHFLVRSCTENAIYSLPRLKYGHLHRTVYV